MVHPLQKTAQKILDLADIKINGDRPWDIAVLNDNLYARVLRHGSLGLGEAYMDGWWESKQLDECISHLLRAHIDKKINLKLKNLLEFARQIIMNYQRPAKAFEVGEHHYDLGNDLYRAMLDRRLTYTCAYWKNAKTLDEAQEAKLDLVCRKLNLQPGQRILDIGCGWGSFMKYAAEKYGVTCVGITVAAEQVKLGRELCRGLPIEIRLEDYRKVAGQFDHIISLGMFEHVGLKNYRTYMDVVARCLKNDGLFLLHTFGFPISDRHSDPWIEKYIFPNYFLPSVAHIARAVEGCFIIEDWHNFGADYDTTLMAWFHNFDAHWGELKAHYSERFYRMWKYYLMVCAGSFRSRTNQLWQVVLSKKGVMGGYQSVR